MRFPPAISPLLQVLLALACAAPSARAEMPTLWASVGSRYSQVVGFEGERATVFDSGAAAAVEAGARWELRGDLAEGIALAEWSPPYSIIRRPESSGEIVATAQLSLGGGGEGPGMLGESWPAAIDSPCLVVATWVVEGKVTQVQVRQLSALEKSRPEGVVLDIRFSLRESEVGGMPGVLLWSKGGWVPPVPRFSEAGQESALRAALLGRDEVLAAALRAGLDVRRVDRQGMTLLALLAEAGRSHCIPVLLAASREPLLIADKGGFIPAQHAARNGREHALSLLAEAGGAPVRPPGDGPGPITLAAGRGHAGCVRVLNTRSEILDTTAQGGLAAEAIDRGDLPVADALLEHASDSVLHCAPLAQSLMRACAAGNADAVRLLIGHGFSVSSARGEGGAGPLHAAAASGPGELVALLAGAGVPLDARDLAGRTALAVAVEARNAAFARALIDAGARAVAVQGGGGDGLLHTAVRMNSSEMVGLLVRAGAPLDARDSAGLTALSLAIDLGNKGCASALLHAGATLSPQAEHLPDLIEAVLRMDLVPVLRSLRNQGWDPDMRLDGGWSLLAVSDLMKAAKCSAFLREAEVREAGGAPCEVVRPEDLDVRLKTTLAVRVQDPRGAEEVFPRQNVAVDLIIDPTGRPRFMRVRNCPDSRLERAVVAALQVARYEAPKRGGQAVAVNTTVTIPVSSSKERLQPRR